MQPDTFEVTEAPAEAEDFEFVRMPDGTVRAVHKSAVHETETQDLPDPTTLVVEERHYYVHLGNGDVIRVKESDLPQTAGQDAPNGYWTRGGAAHYVIGVYPVETTV